MYKPLDIDFGIPEILADSIRGFVDDLNNHNGDLADCYEQDIRNTLNEYDDYISEEHIELLRQYYCKGGIYGSNR